MKSVRVHGFDRGCVTDDRRELCAYSAMQPGFVEDILRLFAKVDVDQLESVREYG